MSSVKVKKVLDKLSVPQVFYTNDSIAFSDAIRMIKGDPYEVTFANGFTSKDGRPSVPVLTYEQWKQVYKGDFSNLVFDYMNWVVREKK